MWGRKRACVDGSFSNLSLGTPFKAVVTKEISSLVKGRVACKRYLSIFEGAVCGVGADTMGVVEEGSEGAWGGSTGSCGGCSARAAKATACLALVAARPVT